MSFKDEKVEITDGASSPMYVAPQFANQPLPHYYPNVINPNNPQQVPPAPVFDSLDKKTKKYYKNVNKHLDYSKEYGYSVTFLVLGLFFWLPLIFNIVYIRSPNNKARNIAFSSLIIASVYFLAAVVVIACVVEARYIEKWDYDYRIRNYINGYY